jgi:mannosidase alpha-like ER degradation enhancer 1
MLGGLLSAHLLATDAKLGYKIDWYNDELLHLAQDLADRLLPAFDTEFGIPWPRIHLQQGVLSFEVKEACTAGAGTLVLEFGVLSRLTGDPKYETKAKVALHQVWERRSKLDLIGNTMSLFENKWVDDISGIGAGIDSFFEYMLKAHILLGGSDYLPMFEKAYRAIKLYLLDLEGFVFKNVHMETGKLATGWIDSLSAFFPGLQVLYGDVEGAIRPHFFHSLIWERFGGLPERYNYYTQDTPLEYYPLRPELVESTYMLYQVLFINKATGDDYYLQVGEKILLDLEKYCRVSCGYASLLSVKSKKRDNRMESFFLSETLMYLYLLFDSEHIINRSDNNAIFTTGKKVNDCRRALFFASIQIYGSKYTKNHEQYMFQIR